MKMKVKKNCKRCGKRFKIKSPCNLYCTEKCRLNGHKITRVRSLARYKDGQVCSIEGCGRRPCARGWCSKHYCRFQKHGDPLATQNVRFNEKVDKNGMVWCSKCRSRVPMSEFPVNLRASWCRKCRRLSKYKMSSAEFDRLTSDASGVCPICVKRPAIVIDHDHSCCTSRMTCGKCVRGVLCRQCNAAIGVLTDAGVTRAALYMRRYARRRSD